MHPVLSLKRRFVVLGIGLCLLLLLAGTGVGLFMFDRFSAEIATRNHTLARSLSAEIAVHLEEPVRNLGKIHAEFGKKPMPSSASRQQLLQSILMFDDYLEQIQFIDHRGRLLTMEPYSSEHIGLDYGNRSYVTGLTEHHNVYWSEVYLSSTTGYPATTVSVAGGTGILAAQFNLAELSAVIDVLPAEHGGFIALVDKGGRVIAHTNRTLVRQNISLLGNRSVQSAVQGKSGSLVETIDGQKGLASFAPIATNGWAVLVFQPEKNAFGVAYRSIGLALGLLVIGVGAISILAYFFLRRMWQPVRELQQQATRIAGGDYRVDLAARYEEFVPIADSFSSMVKAIAEREQAMRESEEKYRMLVQNANSIIMRLDQDGCIRFFNEFAQTFFGYTEQEVLGRHVLGTIVADVGSAGADLRGFVQAALLRPEIVPYHENENMTKSGQRVWVAWTNRPLYDKAGQPCGVLCVGTDITLRKRAQDALATSEQRFATAMDAIREGLWDWQIENNEVYFSPTYYTMLGYEVNEFTPSNDAWFDRVHPDDRGEAERAIRDCLNGLTEGFEIEFRMLKKSGEWCWIGGRGRVVARAADGRAVRMIGTHIDVTERKRLEDERLRSQKLESLGVLAGGIAHDFNNLLAAMLAHVSLVQYRLPPGGENQEDLDAAVNAILRSRDLTRQLMTFTKGGMPVRKPIALHKLIAESAAFVLHGSNCRAELSIADDLRMVNADEAQIVQVLQNLVINAAQAMPGGGIIHVSARNAELAADTFEKLPAGEYVEISVRDTGSGIPEEIRGRIFDPYFTTKAQGTGLGLASVFAIVGNHGGYVTFSTGEGEGTTFTLYLPAIIAVAEEIEMTDRPFGSLSGRVLLMDDEPGIAKAIGSFLQELGLDVTRAGDGAKAVEYFAAAFHEQRRYDIVILDLTVPGGMGGREAFQKMQEIDPDIKAIVSSGYSDDSTMADYREIGFQGALQKPYNLADLIAMIRSILQGPKGEQ